MKNILKLKFDYENTGFGRTHYYVGEENDKKSNIVIIHEKDFERIMLATETGEPFVDLKVGILVELNNKLYITADRNGYTILKDNMKVYVISFIDEYLDARSQFGISYVFDSLEKAKQQLEIIKQHELEQEDKIKELEDTEYELINDDLSFDIIKEGGDFTTRFRITEMEVI